MPTSITTDDYIRQLEAENQDLRRQLQQNQEEDSRLKKIREFLGNLSHDVRTPLTSIQTSIHLLYKLTDDTKREHYLNVLQMQVHHLEKLFFDVYNMARIESEVTTYDFQRVGIDRIILGVLKDFAAAIQEKRHTLTTDFPDGLPRIFADEVKLAHALAHLVENAICYTHDGGTIRVRVMTENNHLVVEVEDNGIGISEKALPHIFEAFYREDTARNLQTGRTGLGLAIASKIIRNHKGWIDVQSAPKEGSLFRVFLPALVLNK